MRLSPSAFRIYYNAYRCYAFEKSRTWFLRFVRRDSYASVLRYDDFKNRLASHVADYILPKLFRRIAGKVFALVLSSDLPIHTYAYVCTRTDARLSIPFAFSLSRPFFSLSLYTYTISKRNKFPFYTVTYRLFKRKLKAENGIIIVVGHEGNLSVYSRKNRFLHPLLILLRASLLGSFLSILRILSTIVFKVRGDLRARFSPSSLAL